MNSPLKWVIIRIPFKVEKVWGSRGMVKVKGTINGFAFRTSLFPTGTGAHTLLVNKRMQAGARVAPGMDARFKLEPDTAVRKATVPAELESIFAQNRALRRWFDALNYSTRKFIADLITNVKSPEARARRADQMAEQLLSTMEAERDPPPILKAAFASEPRAEEGWKLMSITRRRAHLLGIFYYRKPESRARRAARAVQEALRRAEGKGTGRRVERDAETDSF